MNASTLMERWPLKSFLGATKGGCTARNVLLNIGSCSSVLRGNDFTWEERATLSQKRKIRRYAIAEAESLH